MKACLLFFVLILSGLYAEDESQDELQDEVILPDWDEEELKALESGDYVPGSSLMGRIARAILDSDEQEVIEIESFIRDLPEEEVSVAQWSRFLREELVPAYFRQAPQGFLNDPQELLTTQEYDDREGFLNFHARDTDIAYYLYLFDGPQELPEGESLEALVRSQFDAEKSAAIVFYYLGDPRRTQLVFSDKVIRSVSEADRKKVLRMAIEEALEKSDPSSQLDSFSIQLSIRLELLEKLLARRQVVLTQDGDLQEPEIALWEGLIKNEALFHGLMIAGLVVPALLLGFLIRWFAAKRRTYVFPDAEGDALLDAPHAAGVGGVLFFDSAVAPPSSQKKNTPDYLQKM